MSKTGKNESNFTAGIETPFGLFIAEFSQKGLKRLFFPGVKCLDIFHNSAFPENAPCEYRDWIIKTESAIQSQLTGKEPAGSPPLDLTTGTMFQQLVWRELMKIKWGTTRTYGEIASNIGKPGAARAVGKACGANPIPILIPCHRVVAADGSPGGFSAGLKWKKLLLEIESKKLSARVNYF